MAKATDLRCTITLRSPTGTGPTHVTSTNRRNHPHRLVLRTYDPTVRGHADVREQR